ncbi:MAG TPA: UDP-N-acetylglucosamine 2-epimerase (non-hydrolyzing) [Candidatus Norongarragalinales archaeon]|nr:UDP-N-acetylglucosamine 2-epimerase (non-hydrolyzing) [Candidatus Norongarragalinales archaeon]
MKIGILTGTRPDIIKMAPIYWEAKRRGHKAVLIHTSQHFPYHLFEGVYRDLDLPFPPDYLVQYGVVKKLGVHVSKVAYSLDEKANLGLSRKFENLATKITSRRPNPALSVGGMMLELNNLLQGELRDLDILLTHGDTLTNMAGALAASLNLIPVGHVEAGLRTFSKEPFPEQIDTRVADACSDLYFAATQTNTSNLISEGFSKDRIFTVGNTVVDAAIYAARKGAKSRQFFERMGFDFSKKLVYFSCHRRENLMHEKRFRAIAGALADISDKGLQVLWSIRPGTQEAIHSYGLNGELKTHPNLHLVSEIPRYSDIMYFISKCHLVVTDSGSMQEETAALHVPTVTLRYVTDRPESVKAGVNILAPPSSKKSILGILWKASSEGVNKEMRQKKNPYGKGDSARRIVAAIEKFKGRMIEWEHER